MYFTFFNYKAQDYQTYFLNLSGEILHLIGLSYMVASGLVMTLSIDFVLYLSQTKIPDSQKKLLTPQLITWAENLSTSPYHEQHHFIALSLLTQVVAMFTAISLGFVSTGLTFILLWVLGYILFLIGERLGHHLNPLTTSLPAQI